MPPSTVAMLYNNVAHGDDHYLIRDLDNDVFLDAVMDGVTGRHGSAASQAVADALMAAPLTSLDDVVTVLKAVNQTLYQRGGGHWWLTTVSVALCRAGSLAVVSVGDSPVWLIRSDTALALSSHVRAGGQGGRVKLLGARLTLGPLYHAEVPIKPGDRVVLATDGITATIPPDELVDLVRHAATPDEAAAQLQAILTTRRAAYQIASATGHRSRGDDWTAILRFFNSTLG